MTTDVELTDLESQTKQGAVMQTEKLSQEYRPEGATTQPPLSSPRTSDESRRSTAHQMRPSKTSSRSPGCDARTDGSEIQSDASVDEERNLYDFVDKLQTENPPGAPWFINITLLRRLQFLHVNKRLAACKKRIVETRTATDSNMQEVRTLLHEQGTLDDSVCR